MIWSPNTLRSLSVIGLVSGLVGLGLVGGDTIFGGLSGGLVRGLLKSLGDVISEGRVSGDAICCGLPRAVVIGAESESVFGNESREE